MVRLVLAVLALMPCFSMGATLPHHESQSQTMRREPKDSNVRLTAHGEVAMIDQKKGEHLSNYEESGELMCDFYFPLGPEGTNNCTDKIKHKLIESEAMCVQAALVNDGINITWGITLSVEWEKEHPKGCFRAIGSSGKGEYWYNGVDGEWPPLPTRGKPVCWMPEHQNGTTDAQGGCPNGYAVVMDEVSCKKSARCLGYEWGVPPKGFRIGEKNASRKLDYPEGCFINQYETPITAYFNEARDADWPDGVKFVGTNVKGIPICNVSGSAEANATGDDGDPTPAPGGGDTTF